MNPATDYDGAWKEALEGYLRPFLELCFPRIAGRIDWAVPVEFLDKELQEIVRDADLGKQRVDKLAKVRRLDGAQEWVLVHVEVQAQPEEGLPRRVYQYHHRIGDRFGRRVATLVVLADAQAGWKPQCYEEELWGCRLRFEYPICKLLELGSDRDRLEATETDWRRAKTRRRWWSRRIWRRRRPAGTWTCGSDPNGSSPAGCMSVGMPKRTFWNCSA